MRNVARFRPTARSIRRKYSTCEPPRHGSSESLRSGMAWSGFGEELEDDMPVRLKEAFIMSEKCLEDFYYAYHLTALSELKLNSRTPTLVMPQQPSTSTKIHTLSSPSLWHKSMAQTASFSIQHVSPQATNPLSQPLCCHGNLCGITAGRALDRAPTLHSLPQINLFCY